MDLKDILTLLIAIYGAVVSTILALRELKKAKRSIVIFLERNDLYDLYAIVVTNTGHRPFTIGGILIDTPSGPVKQHSIEQENDGLSFPITLADGESTRIKLNRTASDDIREAHENISISVYDGENKEYTKYKKTSYNAKWGQRSFR
jgi:hypothetical protein